MPATKAHALFVIVIILLSGSFLSSIGTEMAEADPLITQNLNALSQNYLPVVYAQQSGATIPPIATSTPEPSNTGDVRITKIFFDGEVFQVESDEYVEIENFDNKIIRLAGWILHDDDVKHTYTFPVYNMQPGEVCRVYTNENHPEWCGLNWRNGGGIWNNEGDEVTLKDAGGKVIDTCGYSGKGPIARCE